MQLTSEAVSDILSQELMTASDGASRLSIEEGRLTVMTTTLLHIFIRKSQAGLLYPSFWQEKTNMASVANACKKYIQSLKKMWPAPNA